MSWCDKLASTPTVGFRLTPELNSGTALLQALTPVLQPLADNAKHRFTIDAVEPFSVQVNTEEGFKYNIDDTRVAVSFNHRMKLVPVSGGAPQLEMLSRPQPYTELLPVTLDKLVAATSLIPNASKRQVLRVGVVSITSVAEEDMPPGIIEFVKYLSRPWGGEARNYQYLITTVVQSGDEWDDTCVHTLRKLEDEDSLISLQFDFGREYKDGALATPETLKRLSKATAEAALTYFERLAEGSMFDEELIRESA